MQLPIPVVGQEPGPDYAKDINTALTLLDNHNHTSGSGVQITPAGINVNTSLTMNNNSLINVGAVTLTAQTTTPASISLYALANDLYFIDGTGAQIRITQSGSVAGSSGTITGLPSGTASASFASSTFTFQSATATAANIDGASYTLRNNTASSFGLTLSPPNAMGANYTLVLPPPNPGASIQVMTLDPAGNMNSVSYDTVGQNMSSVGANALRASTTKTAMATATLGNMLVTASCGSFSTPNTSPFPISNFSGSLVTSGKPIVVMVQDDGTGSSYYAYTATGGTPLYNFILTITGAASITRSIQVGAGSVGARFPASSLNFVIPNLPAGTSVITLSAQVAGGTGGTIFVNNCVLIAYELG